MQARTLALAAASLLGTAGAASAETPLERIEPRLARAIEEQRVFLTCSRLDPNSQELVRASWADLVANARIYLGLHDASAADLKELERRTSLEALLPLDKPFREVAAFCDAHPDWLKRLYNLDFVLHIDDSPM